MATVGHIKAEVLLTIEVADLPAVETALRAAGLQ